MNVTRHSRQKARNLREKVKNSESVMAEYEWWHSGALLSAWMDGKQPNGDFTDYDAEWPVCVENVLQLLLDQAIDTGKVRELAKLFEMYATEAREQDKKYYPDEPPESV